jgi:hypothetical protein
MKKKPVKKSTNWLHYCKDVLMKQKKYFYWVSYSIKKNETIGVGACYIKSEYPIKHEYDIIKISEQISQINKADGIIVISWKLIRKGY